MDWRHEGILLRVRRHGETSAILDVFTREKGRHAGVLRGATSRRHAATLQPGTQIDVSWRARLDSHLGTLTVEPLRSRSAAAFADRAALAGLNAVCSLLVFALPEREPHPALWDRSLAVLDLLSEAELWPLAYLRWELALLEETGFGLDLTRCAVTGDTEGLCLISPRSGRAVTREGAGSWADRLLPLPPVLRGEGPASDADILQGLDVTGHFLHHRLAGDLVGRPLPAARDRLVAVLARRAGAAGRGE